MKAYLKCLPLLGLTLCLVACGGGSTPAPTPSKKSGHAQITNLGITAKPSNTKEN